VVWQTSNTNVFTGDRTFAGPNPPGGAAINYFLRSAAEGGAAIRVLDRSGKLVRTIANAPTKPGVNHVVWDLRYDPPTTAEPAGREGASGRGGRGGGRFGVPVGPPVAPGDYTIVVAAGGHEARKPLRVNLDPRMTVSQADLTAQTAVLLTLRDMTSKMNEVVARSDGLIAQLTTLVNELGGPGGDREVLRFVTEALDRVKTVREPLTRKVPTLGYRYPAGLRDRVNGLAAAIGSYIAGPTATQADYLKTLQPEVEKAVNDMHEILTKTVPDLNSRLTTRPKIIVEPIK